MDLAYTAIVGDRPEDMEAALRFMAEQGMDLILTSGGLGPTADDLTAEVVGRFQGREMVLDEPLSERIAEIVKPLLKRWPNLDKEAIREANRKQATIPAGATVLEPVGTAPGLVVPPGENAAHPGTDRRWSCFPGPPRELQPMWEQAVKSEALRAALEGAIAYRQRMLRLFGIPESEIAETLRIAAREGIELERLEITTCMKRGEIEVVTRYEPGAEDAYEAFEQVIEQRHADTLFSTRRQLRRRAGRGASARNGASGRRGLGEEPRSRIRHALRAHDRHGRVVHGRSAGGAADRSGGRLRVREGRHRRLLERGQDLPGRCPGELIDRARSGVRGGGTGARAKVRGRAWALTWEWG